MTNTPTREIKFRCWDTANKTFIYSDEIGMLAFWADVQNAIYDPAIQQYTNLKDKNGKDIWEGDILELRFIPKYRKISPEIYNHEVCFGDATVRASDPHEESEIVGFYSKRVGVKGGLRDSLLDLVNSPTQETLIVGNIYENKELLK